MLKRMKDEKILKREYKNENTKGRNTKRKENGRQEKLQSSKD